MNIIKFLDQFSNIDLKNASASRREMFSQLGSYGKKAAFAAIPFGLGVTKSNAATMAFFGHVGPLNLALTLEYLESDFYNRALLSNVVPSGRPLDVYEQIAKHENAHVALLESVLGSDAVDKPIFDFTLGGAFDPFNATNPQAYAQLLTLAQAFEDTGVRAYKGQAGNLAGTPYLAPALRIHSVEARHAAEVRRLRSAYYNMELNDNGLGWITLNKQLNVRPMVPAAVYAGEELTVQAGVNLTSLGNGYSAESASQSFDEPITGEEAVAIATPFFA
ncbi:ferritin-like domain-containing protein [Gelidibacter salicanalis]|uniref:Ferritin-like domain-containing protein n=1 Tax=Gelidibacter salicanalis TaxID=291193 RepID=A0A5C7ANQ9_9FLAO|nr:ferritin-like domain-containing protein [Gelidibacter salicanalis]TXE10416.1 ferritin-like domain-containing protein [Gelidibacter salicanalis]